MTIDDLNKLYIKNEEPSQLVDTKIVNVNPELPIEQRFYEYMRQIKNPYHYKCDGVEVLISYSDSDKTLFQTIRDYFIFTK